MTGFTWRWPLALLIGALLVVGIITLIVVLTSRKRLTPGSTNAADTASSDTSGAADTADTAAKQAEDTAPKASRERIPRVWNLRASLTLDPIAARYRAYRLGSLAAIVLVSLALLASLGLLARPSSVDRTDDSASSRDIVLCLDVSGSALPFDREVIASYLELVKNFKNERIGMSIFNSTSRTVFPLTDDYSLVTKQLTSAMAALKGVQTQDDIDNMSDSQYQQIADWLAGTQNRKDATSLIGDGLVNCAAMMPDFSVTATTGQTRRSPASIVFASDNVLSGSPLYTLKEALAITTKNDIRVDGLFSGASESVSDAATLDMKKKVETSGGTFLTRSGTDTVDGLVRSIESESAQYAEQNSTTDLSDNPAPWIAILAVLFCVYLAVMGWLKR